MRTVAWCLLTAIVVWHVAWASAHKTVATECDRLGSFYVGETVYHCVKKEPRKRTAKIT